MQRTLVGLGEGDHPVVAAGYDYSPESNNPRLHTELASAKCGSSTVPSPQFQGHSPGLWLIPGKQMVEASSGGGCSAKANQGEAGVDAEASKESKQ